MNCFVIMPFATDFDDVYAVIKATVEGSTTDAKGRCFRLDESRPAGRITDRLLAELRSATICIADLTENKPNVMWELGFAMALEKPVIIVTQSVATLPFDIKDMQSIEYNRTRLNATLGAPLKQSLLDTMGAVATNSSTASSADAETVGTILSEVAQLKAMMSEVVNAWKIDETKAPQLHQEIQTLAGHWFNTESKSHVHMRVIRGELIAPYCYGGNSDLTGVYFGWRRTGEYWFARYQWIKSHISGFSFLRMDSLERMSGAWWSSEHQTQEPDAHPRSKGVPANWIRQNQTLTPRWAEDFFVEVEKHGLASLLAKCR
ncbi:MAG TPA: nucleoside 2-deoxyribosyltransferase [Rhodocyclaceae bacterium]|nr:nucleoside 2-deoxyribosyltransferase [Rhodocyclaceae bacterium]HMZ56271.1 nucleoside 2-deoxyribosyltransferase [Nitrospira sp.]HNI69583.1 nucleoside 2-deoxyribosyltransferase [Nitrospira sp.]